MVFGKAWNKSKRKEMETEIGHLFGFGGPVDFLIL
jgi:hypothetical protein